MGGASIFNGNNGLLSASLRCSKWHMYCKNYVYEKRRLENILKNIEYMKILGKKLLQGK